MSSNLNLNLRYDIRPPRAIRRRFKRCHAESDNEILMTVAVAGKKIKDCDKKNDAVLLKINRHQEVSSFLIFDDT